MQDRADPHARERAFDIAHKNPPPGSSQMKPSRKSANCSIRSATPARSAPATPDRRRAHFCCEGVCAFALFGSFLFAS